MPIQKSESYNMVASDDVVEVVFAEGATPIDVTIRLPTRADVLGRSFSVVKKNNSTRTVTVKSATATTAVLKTFSATDQFVSETFIAGEDDWTIINAAGYVPKYDDYIAVRTDRVIHVDTADGDVTVTLYSNAETYIEGGVTKTVVGNKLRIANFNGSHNVIVDGHLNQTTIDSYNAEGVATALGQITLEPGRSINLIVVQLAGGPKWKNQAADIQSVELLTAGTVAVGDTKTVVNVDATAGNVVVELPDASDRYGKSTIGPMIFVSKTDKTTNTVSVIKKTGSNDTTISPSIILSAPGTVSVRAVSADKWQSGTTAKTSVELNGAGSSVTDLDADIQVHKLTLNGAKSFRLPTSATQLLEINNTGTGDATIYAAANKKLFTSGGYVPSVTITSGRSSAFSYSAGLNAWVKV